MELAIIGFPQSGKTTVFQAATGGRAESSRGDRATLGVVKVPDSRLDALAAMFRPKKVTPAEVTYVDIPSAAGLGHGKGVEGQFLNDLARADALIHVVEGFREKPNAATIKERISSMELELVFADLGIIDRRLDRIESSKKGGRGRALDTAAEELHLLSRIKASLEEERPVREQSLGAEASRAIKNYQFLTAKPLIVVVNIAEESLPEREAFNTMAGQEIGTQHVIAVCGTFEAELAALEESEAREFMEDAGITESSLRRLIRLSYDAMGLVSFLTAGGPNEVRAWSLPAGSTAPQAASKIHSDMERGFIRAEVVDFNELVNAGSFANARKLGVLRVEGKGYIVQDGDVITFLFNV